MGFSSRWITWVMLCVASVNYSVALNGSTVGPIKPKRGLRQGDPLSTYLFLFYVDGVSIALTSAVVKGLLNDYGNKSGQVINYQKSAIFNSYWWKSNGSNSRGIRWMSWNKMAVPKSRGGLGFRDLHGFNVALLGKHVWNFLQKLESLVTRIFKARYFPDRHILQALKGNDSNFIWSGIWEEKEKLKGGFRWVLGDGKARK
ncbi:putative mitochondrial protein AtMg00310 [Apium graveolens]|uniref:putative mitochondrial protein AtMg00310 n=1 Tax=Apium graveolens TaxID=4045 RepID=UPI003D7BED7D